MPMALGLGLGLPYMAGPSGPSPALDLNFVAMAASQALDSRITYTGNSLGTLTNSAGNIAYKPHNLALNSDDLTTGWSGATATAAPGTSRTGGNSTRVQLLSGEARQRNSSPGSTYAITSSVGCWIKSNTGSSQTVRLKNTHSGVIDYFSPDLTVTTSWQFFSFTQTFTAAAGGGTVLIGVATNVAGTAADILVGEFQHNIGPLQPYYPTTSAAYFGPRFTYDPITHAALGLLIEEQRTNLLTYSEQFDNAAWTLATASVTANATTAPDGASTADKLVEDSTAAVTHRLYGAATVTAVAHTLSVYAKPAGRSIIALRTPGGVLSYFNVSTGTVGSVPGPHSAKIESVGNGWYRCSVTWTPTAGAINVGYDACQVDGSSTYNGDGTSGIYLWGAQLEAGAFATSYIPTTSASVTRAADSATMTGTNFSSWFNASAGTFVAQFVVPSLVASTYKRVFSARNVANTERVEVWVNGAGTVRIGSTTGGSTTETSLVAAVSAGQVCKVAASYTASGMSASLNGGTVYTHSATVNGAVMTVLDVGLYDAANRLCAPVSRLRYYNTALTNAQLQALTA